MLSLRSLHRCLLAISLPFLLLFSSSLFLHILFVSPLRFSVSLSTDTCHGPALRLHRAWIHLFSRNSSLLSVGLFSLRLLARCPSRASSGSWPVRALEHKSLSCCFASSASVCFFTSPFTAASRRRSRRFSTLDLATTSAHISPARRLLSARARTRPRLPRSWNGVARSHAASASDETCATARDSVEVTRAGDSFR